VLHNRQFLLHWWHMLFNKCAYDNKHVSITDLLKVLSLFHQQALNRIGGVMVNVFVSWSHHLTKNGGLGPVTFHWGAYNKQVSGHVYVYLSVDFAFLRFFDLIFSLIRLVVFFLSISSAISLSVTGPTWSWSYCSWIYNYSSNQCLTPLTLEFEPRSWRGVIDTTLCNTVCQWVAAGLWISPCTPLIKLTYLIYCWKWR
jgi:hypothetical protein